MSGMMNALVWRGGSNLTLDQLPEPEPGPGQVAFDVGLAGICGSDLHPYRGHAGPRLPPLVLGHEAIGKIDALGEGGLEGRDARSL